MILKQLHSKQWLKVIAQFNGGRQLSKHQAQAMTKLETKVMKNKKEQKPYRKNNKNSIKTNKTKESQSSMQNTRKLKQMKKEVKIMRKAKPFIIGEAMGLQDNNCKPFRCH